MKILLVHNYYRDRGGEDVYFDSLVKLLKKNGCQVITFTKKSSDIISIDKKVEAIKSLFNLNNKINRELSGLISKERPDVAHFHNLYPSIGPAAYYVCKKYNIPIVQTIHNYRLSWPEGIFFSPSRSWIYSLIFSLSILFNLKKKVYDLVDYFIFPSRFAYNYYLKHARFKIKKYSIIFHFADIKLSVKPIKKSNYFLFAGRFSQEKGIIPLLQVFSKLPKINLLVIGDGPEKYLVDRYKKCGNIKILGWLKKEQLNFYIKRALGVVIPSLSYEVLPLSAIESLSLGTLIIVPKTAVFEEIIKDKKGVIFFRYNDFNDLQNKIIKTFKNPPTLKNISYNEFSPDKHYLSLKRIYKRLI